MLPAGLFVVSLHAVPALGLANCHDSGPLECTSSVEKLSSACSSFCLRPLPPTGMGLGPARLSAIAWLQPYDPMYCMCSLEARGCYIESRTSSSFCMESFHARLGSTKAARSSSLDCGFGFTSHEIRFCTESMFRLLFIVRESIHPFSSKDCCKA